MVSVAADVLMYWKLPWGRENPFNSKYDRRSPEVVPPNPNGALYGTRMWVYVGTLGGCGKG